MSLPPQIVMGYDKGKPFPLDVLELEGGFLLRAELVPRAKAMIQEARDGGLTVKVENAFRTYAKQAFLHDGWEARLPGFNPADPPGYSAHQRGDALDLAFGDEAEREKFAAEIAPKYGFTRPTPERWHFVGGADPLVT